MIWAVIMAGGRGDRFWPRSRARVPKQLLPIAGTRTMIRQTLERLEGLVSPERILVITQAIQKDEMLRQLPELPAENVIAEPVGRDTAAAVGLAALLVSRFDADGKTLVLPADHVIHDIRAFERTVHDAEKTLDGMDDALFTFGIRPSFPATGYGYLRTGEKLDTPLESTFHRVAEFVEKPDATRAASYLERGGYLWNSGMFFWRADTLLKEIRGHMPALDAGLSEIGRLMDAGTPVERALEKIYPGLEKKSVDYGIMERAENVVCAVAGFDWDDVGSWEALGKHFRADDRGNVCVGNARLINCSNLLVYNLCEDENLLATAIDLSDQILVQTEDAVLCCPKTSAQKVRHLVDELRAEKLEKYL
jgi:mannose-1-phosphate guanylyltransferase